MDREYGSGHPAHDLPDEAVEEIAKLFGLDPDDSDLWLAAYEAQTEMLASSGRVSAHALFYAEAERMATDLKSDPWRPLCRRHDGPVTLEEITTLAEGYAKMPITSRCAEWILARDQARSLVLDIGTEAARVAEGNYDRFAWHTKSGVQALEDLMDAVKWEGVHQLNFSAAFANPIAEVKSRRAPEIQIDEASIAAGKFLDLPFRPKALERLVIETLVAAEVLSFASEIINGRGWWHWFLPGRSINPASVLVPYLINLVFVFALFGIPAVCVLLAAPLIGSLTAEVIGGALFTIAIILAFLSTAYLPIAWLRARKIRKTTEEQFAAMLAAAGELRSQHVSMRRLREALGTAADKGVAWPSNLFAILDQHLDFDAQRRGGAW